MELNRTELRPSKTAFTRLKSSNLVPGSGHSRVPATGPEPYSRQGGCLHQICHPSSPVTQSVLTPAHRENSVLNFCNEVVPHGNVLQHGIPRYAIVVKGSRSTHRSVELRFVPGVVCNDGEYLPHWRIPKAEANFPVATLSSSWPRGGVHRRACAGELGYLARNVAPIGAWARLISNLSVLFTFVDSREGPTLGNKQQ